MKYVYGFFYKHSKIKENVILIESFHGKTIGDSGLVFAREILKEYPGKYKVYFATTDPKNHAKLIKSLGLGVDLVTVNTFKYAKVLASARLIISNASLPIYYIRKDGQDYIQTWHGTPLKTLGKQMRAGIESMYNVQHNFLQADYLTFPNEYTKKAIMRDYNLEPLYTGDVIMCGYPRNQIFLEEGKADAVRRKYGLDGKTVYAYMPTWRGTDNQSIDNTDYTNELYRILKDLDRKMKDDQEFYINFHPILKNTISYKKFTHIKPFPDDCDTYEFLNAADALVTDYSSVFFDFSLTKKPIILFMYDYDKYMADRGTYMDVKDLPFRKIYETDEFCETIASGAALGDRYDDTEYYKEFFKYDSTENAKNVLGLVLDNKETGLEIISYEKNREKKVRVFRPDNVRQESDLRTLSEVASGDSDVVLLYRKWFKKDLSMMMYDKYNDSFNYVITTDTPPRTYIEQIKRKLGNKSADRRIAKDDMKRCFGRLNVEPEYVTEFGKVDSGYQVDWSKVITVDADITSGDDGSVTVRYDAPKGLKVLEAAMLDDRDSLVRRRPLTEDEEAGSHVRYDYHGVIEDLTVYVRELATPGLICEDKDGNKVFVGFTSLKKKKYFKNGNVASDDGSHQIGRFFIPAKGEFDLPKDYFRTNLRRILNSFDEDTRASISGYIMEKQQTKLLILPYVGVKNSHILIRTRISAPDNAIKYISNRAVYKGSTFAKDHLTVKAFLPGWESTYVKGALLKFNSKTEDIVIPAEVEVKDRKKGCMVKMTLRYRKDMPFESLRWYCMIKVLFGGDEHLLSIKCFNPFRGFKLYAGNIQSELPDGHIVYPYLSKGGNIFNIAYRERSEYDDVKTRVKEFAALFLFFFMRPFLKMKKYYIVYEKFCHTAQDNSLYFFRYCMEKLPPKERKKFYYIIDKRSSEYENVKEYDSRVIQFMSIKHMIYAMGARLCIATDSTPHLYTWQTKPSLVYDIIHDQGVLFLQHGVTALKRVDNLFGKKGASPMKYFVTTSPFEQRIVMQNFGYKKADAPMVGFTRWDVLEDKKKADDPFILIMPTWRLWLENVTEEGFLESEYYKHYKDLLTDDRFNSMLEDNGLRAILYLHPKFASHIDSFRDHMSSLVTCIQFGEKQLNEIMMRCSMLITDYSSVCWDVMYMDKPVLFYQFDYDKYMQVHGSYIDMTKDLPAPRATEKDELIGMIAEHIENGFTMKDEYESRMGDFFEFRDSNNSARTYKFLMDREERGLS